MAWLILCIAGILEIAFAVFLKASLGFSRWLPSALTVATGLASVVLLSISLRTLPVGTGYAVWTGIGAVGTVIVGMAMFDDSISPWRLICIGFVVVGMIGLKVTS